jgi:hypothetical protein
VNLRDHAQGRLGNSRWAIQEKIWKAIRLRKIATIRAWNFCAVNDG